jgi:hypothetical protein
MWYVARCMQHAVYNTHTHTHARTNTHTRTHAHAHAHMHTHTHIYICCMVYVAQVCTCDGACAVRRCGRSCCCATWHARGRRKDGRRSGCLVREVVHSVLHLVDLLQWAWLTLHGVRCMFACCEGEFTLRPPPDDRSPALRRPTAFAGAPRHEMRPIARRSLSIAHAPKRTTDRVC